MHAYILLDRTGSMGAIWTEALGAVNAYAASLKESAQPGTSATLAVFDAHDGLQFEILRDGVPVSTWIDVTDAEATPRGMTPLFDAIGRIVARAEKDASDRAVIVIMTDGEENSSREFKKEDVRAALDRCSKRGWQVVFLGADFAKFSDAEAVGVAAGQTMAMSSAMMQNSMRSLAKKSARYFAQTESGVSFDDKDREEASEAEVQKRKGS